MSRPDSIEGLLSGSASEIAPTVTDLAKQAKEDPKPEPAKPAKTPERKHPKPKAQQAVGQRRAPIRFQVSAPEGGEVERALEEILAEVPQALRSGISIGTLFRQVMIDNDEEIATMIRKSVGE
ncbi:hypothetical protein [Ruegeria hyattellae]|uniref:hypothetical protein n=1 Tax=Ruegeria hyattellae TaxID=3233337 RepID=UPI00355B75EB